MEKTLLLTLNKEAFEVMVTGEKDEEFRRDSKWIRSRLMEKNGTPKSYAYVKFINGYGADKPYFIAEFHFRVQIARLEEPIKEYSNGLKVKLEKGMWVIGLGEIVETGNLRNSKI